MKITESQLKDMIAESIRKVLKESAFRYTNTDDFLYFLGNYIPVDPLRA